MNLRIAKKARNKPREVVRNPGYGFSQESRTVRMHVREVRDHAAESISLGGRKEIKDRIWELYLRCGEPGWDGGDADPVQADACRGAVRFVDLMPDGLKRPDVVPECDGELALEWESGADRIFSIGFDTEGINYAGFFGGRKKFRGQEEWGDVIPEEVATILVRHFSKE